MLIEATSLTKDFPRARKGSRVFTAVAPLDLALEAGQVDRHHRAFGQR